MYRSKFSAAHAVELMKSTVPSTTGPEKAVKAPMTQMMQSSWSAKVRVPGSGLSTRLHSHMTRKMPVISAPTRTHDESTCVTCCCEA